MGHRWHLRTPNERALFMQFAEEAADAGSPISVEIIKPGRSISQNAKIYSLYRTIADQKQDWLFEDAKNHCKLHFGIGIMKSHDPEFADWYDKIIKGRSYEEKLVFVQHLDLTKDFTKEQASEYIDTIILEFQRQGIYFKEAV